MSKNQVSIEPELAWRIYELLGELVRFLHQSKNYERSDQIEAWLKEGVYKELHELFYEHTYDWFPPDEETGDVEPPPGCVRKFSD